MCRDFSGFSESSIKDSEILKILEHTHEEMLLDFRLEIPQFSPVPSSLMYW